MSYELRSIFRTKVTWVCMLLCLVIIMLGTVGQLRDASDNDSNIEQITLMCENEIMTCQEDIDKTEENMDYNLNTLCDTEAKKKVFLAQYEYTKWRCEEWAKIRDYVASDEFESKHFKKKCERVRLIDALCNMEIYSSDENDCPKVEKVFAEELKTYETELALQNLPFKIGDLADSPFMTEQDRESQIPIYQENKSLAEGWFQQLAYPQTKNFYSKSPYALLGVLFTETNGQYTGLILSCIILMFCAFYTINCRQNGSRQLWELRPQKKGRLMAEHYIELLVAISIILIVVIGIPVIAMGMTYGWGGLRTIMKVDPGNFNSFTPYEHFPEWVGDNLGIVYSDYHFFGNVTYIVMKEMRQMELWQFMLYAGGIAVLKVIFLTLLGFGIGYSFMRMSAVIAVSSIVCAGFIAGRFLETNTKWNPFSIQTAWNVTSGGTNMTWLNAVLVLVMAIVVLALLIRWINGKQDYL